MTKTKKLERSKWLKYCKGKEMVINLPLEAPTKAIILPIGYVIDQLTKNKFYYDNLVTVPVDLGYITEYQGQLFPVYDSPPCLAPSMFDKSEGIIYLHPSRISIKDKDHLTELYKKEFIYT